MDSVGYVLCNSPRSLLARQHLILSHFVHLTLVNLNDDSHKHVEEEHIEYDDDDDMEQSEQWLVLNLRLLVNLYRTYHLLLNIIQALSRLNQEDHNHALANVIKVNIVVLPFAPIAQTVPLSLDQLFLLLGRKFCLL